MQILIKSKTAKYNYILLQFILLFLIVNYKSVKEAALSSFIFCAKSLIPSLFPFMIITDLICNSIDINTFTENLPKFILKIFKISNFETVAIILGSLCGFPIGAKVSSDLYEKGLISEKELNRITIATNNVSLPFCLGTVGTIWGIKESLIIWSVCIISSLLYLVIASNTDPKAGNTKMTTYNKSLIESIHDTTENSIYLSSIIIVFGIIISLTKNILQNEITVLLISCFLEVGNAVNIILTNLRRKEITATLLSFSMSFTGISVYLQTKSIFIGKKAKLCGYIKGKLIVALISSIITFCIFLYI